MDDDRWPPPWWPHTEAARWLLLALALILMTLAILYATETPNTPIIGQ